MREPTEEQWQRFHAEHAGIRLLQGIALVIALGCVVFGNGSAAFVWGIVGPALLQTRLPMPPG